jgi:HK97 family phage major capsid protein
MSAKTAKALGAELTEKRQALSNLFDSLKTEDGGYDRSKNPQVIDEIRRRNDELDTLGKEYQEAKSFEVMASRNADGLAELSEPAEPIYASAKSTSREQPAPQTLGEMFVKSVYNADRNGKIDTSGHKSSFLKWNVDCEAKWNAPEFKTTMTTAAGWSPENLRSGKVQLSAQRPITLFDIVPMIPLSTGNAYSYMLETTFTNNAAAIAENDGTGSPESAFALTETTVAVRNISTFVPVTDEQLADVAGAQAYVDTRLSYAVKAKAEYDLLNADGNAPNFAGYYTTVTQAQALGSDTKFDAIFKAMVKVRHTGFANPDAVVIHPNDWQDFRLTRTTDGIYILGNPADPGPMRLFGINVVETTAALENTALVGDFTGYSAMVYRGGLQLKVSDQHSDYFIKHKQAIRANIRAALVVFRATAFCEVTGL